jgi:GTP pyrophosphokinase
MTKDGKTSLGELFQRALVYGAKAHEGHARKGSGVPYYSHPLQVAGIALEHGADEEQAVAALLHDVIEDTPTTHADLARTFGMRVADIVRALSDTEDHEAKAPWRQRKVEYLAHLSTVGPDVALVSCADKLHNARSILMDLRAHGPDFMERTFSGKREGTLWYYRALVDTFADLDVPATLQRELRIVVEELEARA